MTQNFEMEFFYVELKELDDNQKKMVQTVWKIYLQIPRKCVVRARPKWSKNCAIVSKSTYV